MPFIGAAFGVAGLAMCICRLCGLSWTISCRPALIFAVVLSLYFLFFFRDPSRTPPETAGAVVAGADGIIARITELPAQRFFELTKRAGLAQPQLDRFGRGKCVRISIFLSLFDVHVNRAPIRGTSTFLGYFPGKHFFTFQEKSSDNNQHNSILIENDETLCLVNQIVGPVCRRVVYWPDHDKPVEVKAGDPIGMMKFGSRLDMYFPAGDIVLEVREGDRVRAGETLIARTGKEPSR